VSGARAALAPERRYAGQSDVERLAALRERLLEAGLELYGTAGYAATTIEQVCKAARVTARHFYEEYEGREALLVAVYDRVIARARDAVLAAVTGAPDGDPVAQIRAGVGAFVHAYIDDPRHVRIACIECVGVSAAMETHRREVTRAFAGLIRARVDALAGIGLAERRDYQLTAIALAGATNELLVEWASRRRGRPSADVIIDELERLYLGALGGTRPAA
jgi:AcrR family transcriptional regulator